MGKKKKNKKHRQRSKTHTSSSGRTRANGYSDDDVEEYVDFWLAQCGYYSKTKPKDFDPITDRIFGSSYYCVGDGKKAKT